MELQAQVQVNTDATITRPPPYRDAKSKKLQAFVHKKNELDSYLLRFERYGENDKWEKITWAVKFSTLPSGRALDVNTRMKMQTTMTEEGTLNQLTI